MRENGNLLFLHKGKIFWGFPYYQTYTDNVGNNNHKGSKVVSNFENSRYKSATLYEIYHWFQVFYNNSS